MAESPAPPAKPSTDDESRGAGGWSFLSLLKASHEATKLYVSLLGLLAAVPIAARLLDERLNIHDLRISYAVCLVPALLILGWLVPKWREQLNRRRTIDLGIHGQVRDPEYFRLTPYDAASDFRRADHAHEKVYAWLVGNPAPLLYLSGASGSGKS
ncbi:hypothetical protein PQR67_07610, partial [Paraburkholderia fungorum]|uniref:hypothetical protein n=1 Tax=Paraburkholderia fungorum TaxID=134537 RepID=UPI0038B8D67C